MPPDASLLPPDTRLELLAPARDLECGLTAIRCGADAVYIGAPRFGAREGAGNSLEDIAALIGLAHKYWARVYVTLNTLLYDREIPMARGLAVELHDIGADGLIIQDVGLLECDLPPIPLIASTQMHNHTPERVSFLQEVGFHRAILARELDIETIREIRRTAPRIELECFVHGALCVSYSGQCTLSYALGGRSGNRGQCAQPCRKPYTLVTESGRVLARNRHLLSLRDLNLSDHLGDLIRAGISSFKIEGRLKDKAYVANVVGYYRARLDAVMAEMGLRRSSSGRSVLDFTPDPHRTFNRSYTTYFLNGRTAPVASHETPKMIGPRVGRVTAVKGKSVQIQLEPNVVLAPADGLCFFDRNGDLRGTLVNGAQGNTVTPDKMDSLEKGIVLHRNHDHRFLARLRNTRAERRIGVDLTLRETPEGLLLCAEDEDGIRAEAPLPDTPEPARNAEQALAGIEKQLGKTGETEFTCTGLHVELRSVPFLAVSALNGLRREVLERLAAVRADRRPVKNRNVRRNTVPYPDRELSTLGNVLNRQAEAFLRRHGVIRMESAAESGLSMQGRKVMTTRYCLREELGLCPRKTGTAAGQPMHSASLFLIDGEGHRLEIRFLCDQCGMEIFLTGKVLNTQPEVS